MLGDNLLDSRALTRIQSITLVAIIVIAALGFALIYFFWNPHSGDVIKIGFLGDIDNVSGKAVLQGAILAAEQVNAEGGVLGKQIIIVTEDDDSESQQFDVTFATNALTKLIKSDKVDFLFSSNQLIPMLYQDICAEQNMIFFSMGINDQMTQRVADDYNRYKGFFRAITNTSSAVRGLTDSFNTLRDYTGFNKIAYLTMDLPAATNFTSRVVDSLAEQGFEIVYENTFPPTTIDFSSYFAAIEESEAEIVGPLVPGDSSISFVKEYYDRQSPFVIWGNVNLASDSDFWQLTDGKCESVSFVGYPVVSGYPLTSKVIPMREAYLEQWGEIPSGGSAYSYDLIRFILPDAIKRAGTTETEAVISTLEETDVETVLARHFIYTSNHDVFVGKAGPNIPTEDYLLVCLFQWQNGIQVPVYPSEIMEEARVTYNFPDWAGPWEDIS